MGWKTKRSSQKTMSITIYDILTENKFPENKVDELTQKIIESSGTKSIMTNKI